MATTKMPSSLEIAQSATLRPITEIAADVGLHDDEVELYGRYKAKVDLSVLERLADRPNGKLIGVTAITPTKAGEGKTTTAVGLTQGLGKIGKSPVLCLREASLGPVFGIKGGAAGGGYSQVVPMEDLNLHFTGDIHAIGAANNLLSAMLEAHILHGNALGIDPLTISWRRCVDMNDRALRSVVIGLGGRANGYVRETGFDITAASEVMAIAAVARDLFDLRKRLGAITVGYTWEGEPVTAEQLKAAGAMTVLLKDAIKPNLVQTLEGQPAFIHCGPFANIAHGNSSLVADLVGLKLGDYVVTESGFGSDMGMEKLLDIVCPAGGDLAERDGRGRDGEGAEAPRRRRRRRPRRDRARLREPRPAPRNRPRVRAQPGRRDQPVPGRHRRGGRAWSGSSRSSWARTRPPSTPRSRTAARVRPSSPRRSSTQPTTPATSGRCTRWTPRSPPRSRRSRSASTAPTGSTCSRRPRTTSHRFTEQGLDRVPICMAKTHLSLSADPNLTGAPTGFTVPVRAVRAYTGAGWLVALCGDMQTMPGLSATPAAFNVDIDENGRTVGLF